MQPAYFFEEKLQETTSILQASAETLKHLHVLRYKIGDELILTNGKGLIGKCIVTEISKKNAVVTVQHHENKPQPKTQLTIAISLLKNPARFEWFLEKATEIGVTAIIPLLCHRTEKLFFRKDRLQNIIKAAMLQSEQCWLPTLTEPMPLKEVLATEYDYKFIAHCLPNHKQILSPIKVEKSTTIIQLIGPEGDFTEEEIAMALEKKYTPVSLGNNRLRTETAGMVAAGILLLPS